jgi:hypothetical protein
VYPGQVPLETDHLYTNRNAMVALAFLAQDLLGTSTVVAGLACTPGTGLTVSMARGRIYGVDNIDDTAYSSLGADTTHQVLKQGILLDPATLSCPAPATAGFSINYLIEAAFTETDTGSVTLPYFNAANPTQAWAGANNTGIPQHTLRQGLISLQAKAGVAATTGTQTTPSVDTGYVGLNVVTVANGASSIVTGNIAAFAGAPVLNLNLGATRSTGWGTPTNASVQNNFTGSSATLAQTGAAVAQIIAVLKSFGFLGA